MGANESKTPLEVRTEIASWLPWKQRVGLGKLCRRFHAAAVAAGDLSNKLKLHVMCGIEEESGYWREHSITATRARSIEEILNIDYTLVDWLSAGEITIELKIAATQIYDLDQNPQQMAVLFIVCATFVSLTFFV